MRALQFVTNEKKVLDRIVGQRQPLADADHQPLLDRLCKSVSSKNRLLDGRLYRIAHATRRSNDWYSSTQTGSREVFVESMPEAMGGPAAGAKQKVSIAGGTQPSWRADGKEIFYVAADGKMMSVEFGAASFKLGVPKSLFQTRLEFDSVQRQYDVSADGQRFLLAQPLEEGASVPITVIFNWPTLLKKGAGAP
jgi:hypothetical protein